MRIEELSIGDWVRMGKDNFQIYHLTLAGDVYGFRRTNNSFTGEEYYDGEIGDVHPIPLTPEILEKNGFKIYHKGIEFDHYDTDFENGKSLLLSFDRGKNYYLMYEERGKRGMHQIDCPLRSVHQLQHALRLASIEKDIEL